MRLSRIAILTFLPIHLFLRIASVHERSVYRDLRRDHEQELVRQGEICVGYNVASDMVEHHKAHYWDLNGSHGYVCHKEDFHNTSVVIYGML